MEEIERRYNAMMIAAIGGPGGELPEIRSLGHPESYQGVQAFLNASDNHEVLQDMQRLVNGCCGLSQFSGMNPDMHDWANSVRHGVQELYEWAHDRTVRPHLALPPRPSTRRAQCSTPPRLPITLHSWLLAISGAVNVAPALLAHRRCRR
jgi:hypothetical protein